MFVGVKRPRGLRMGLYYVLVVEWKLIIMMKHGKITVNVMIFDILCD